MPPRHGRPPFGRPRLREPLKRPMVMHPPRHLVRAAGHVNRARVHPHTPRRDISSARSNSSNGELCPWRNRFRAPPARRRTRVPPPSTPATPGVPGPSSACSTSGPCPSSSPAGSASARAGNMRTAPGRCPPPTGSRWCSGTARRRNPPPAPCSAGGASETPRPSSAGTGRAGGPGTRSAAPLHRVLVLRRPREQFIVDQRVRDRAVLVPDHDPVLHPHDEVRGLVIHDQEPLLPELLVRARVSASSSAFCRWRSMHEFRNASTALSPFTHA